MIAPATSTAAAGSPPTAWNAWRRSAGSTTARSATAGAEPGSGPNPVSRARALRRPARCRHRAGRRSALARLTGLGPFPGSAPAVADLAVVLPADLLHAFHAVGGEPAAAVEVAGAIIGVQRPEGHRRALGDVRQHRAHQLAGHATAPGGRLEVDGVDLNGGPVGVLVAAGAERRETEDLVVLLRHPHRRRPVQVGQNGPPLLLAGGDVVVREVHVGDHVRVGLAPGGDVHAGYLPRVAHGRGTDQDFGDVFDHDTTPCHPWVSWATPRARTQRTPAGRRPAGVR